MTDRQNNFWRSLAAPFPENSYKTRDGHSGRKYTYLAPRAIMNRLDDVVGPANWDLQYIETSRGMICRIIIEAPDETEHGWKRVSRDGGGGFRAMNDDDSTFKTGFSSAIKTAAAALGIGRELYEEGMPIYCADMHDTIASGAPSSGPGTGKQPVRPTSNGNGSNGNGNGGYSNEGPSKPPFGRTGKAAYAWAMDTGKHFNADILGCMGAYAKSRKKPERTDQWDEGFLDEALNHALAWIRGLPSYNGEYGKREATKPATGAQAPTSNGSAGTSPVIPAIVAACNALIQKQTGREARKDEIVAMISEIASSVSNGRGSRGEVLESLKNCTDQVWLKNILAQANRMIQEAAQQDADMAVVDDDIPF